MSFSSPSDPPGRASGAASDGTGEQLAVPREVLETISVLVIDDEHTLRESCASLLRSEGFQVSVCGRGDEASDLIRRKPFDIMLVDLYMSQKSGMQLLELAREEAPNALVILMTGNPSVETSIEGLRAGAWDYLPKPFSASHLQIILGRAAHTVQVARESRDGGVDVAQEMTDGSETRILGVSRELRGVVELARKVASTDASVFITGESGTGKELIAHYIHEHSRRRSRRLVPINCAAIPESLLESEMFGHVQGAFTGAVRDKQGLLEVAHGGTLFLDELTEMPAPTQAKLLRVIQDGVVRRVGSTQTDAVVNVRFIAATNHDPVEAVREGRLRKDLHYRLRVVPIDIPPLRERVEDIPVLARHFLRDFWAQHRPVGDPSPTLSEEAVEALVRWPWRGNVRELRNVIEHLVVLADPGEEVQAPDVPFIEDEIEETEGGFSFERAIRGSDYHTARERILAEFEQGYLEHVVREAGGNISDAARIAGVDRTTLYRLMEKHGTSKRDLINGTSD
ncbi:MAG TPA: sigma-54 dependent transcriptional regulator [Longimicrobiales bacterium]|nr:sigma-54 dependent transcriptional regulator [Longimicrobiales bacterium]